MDQTHRGGLEAPGNQSVIEAGEFMGVDSIGHPVTHPRLDMTLVAALFPIAASWPPWASASSRGGKKLIDKNIKGDVRQRGQTVAVFDPQLCKSQFGIPP